MTVKTTNAKAHVKLSSLLIPIAMVALSSCDTKETEITQVIEVEKEIIWDWSEYPQSSEIQLRTLAVSIQPKQTFEIKSESNGIITIRPNQKHSTVLKGDLIAEMDVETLSEDEEQIKLEEEKQLLENLKDEQLNIPEKRKLAQEEMSEAKRKVKLLEHILKNPAMADIAQELVGSDIGTLNDNSLAEAQEVLALAQKKLEWFETFDEQIRQGQKRLQDIDMDRKRRKYQDTKDRSIYTAPFDGELRLEVNFIEGQNEYTVTGRETIATVNNYDEIHAHVKVSNASWVSLQPERLQVQLTNENQTLMTFLEDRIDKDIRTRKEERKYIFTVPHKSDSTLKRLTGTEIQAKLTYKLPENCHIVPKYDLSLYAADKEMKTIDWNEVTQKLWPEAKILAVGSTHLAIHYKQR